MRQHNQGFTLIETVVVVGVLGMIMVSVTMILANSFRARARVSIADVVEQSGNAVLSELKNNVVFAVGIGMSCTTSGVGSSLALVNGKDGGITTLVCYEGVKIASESANGNFDLTRPSVRVTNCNSFVNCELFPGSTDRINVVNFKFDISQGDAVGGAESFVNRTFNSSVTVRN